MLQKHHAPPSINFGEFPITFPNRFCHGHDHRWLGWGKYCKYPNTCNAAYRLYVFGYGFNDVPCINAHGTCKDDVTVFLFGAFLGVLGGIIASIGIFYSSLMLLALGTLCVGAYQSFAQFLPFCCQ